MKIIPTLDGSQTILLEGMDETYHSTKGAVTESEHVFIKMGLNYFAENYPDCVEVNVLEVGLGTGLNVLMTATKMPPALQVNLLSLEPFPLEEEIYNQVGYRELSPEIYDAIHNAPWEKPVDITAQLSLTKVREKLEDTILAPNSIQLIYMDAFGPMKQPELWTVERLEQLYDALSPGGILVTYCAKGQFKRDLKSVGFKVEAVPGPIKGKRENTRAVKPVKDLGFKL